MHPIKLFFVFTLSILQWQVCMQGRDETLDMVTWQVGEGEKEAPERESALSRSFGTTE